VLVIGRNVCLVDQMCEFQGVSLLSGRAFYNGCASYIIAYTYTGVGFCGRCKTLIRILLAGVTANIGSLKYVFRLEAPR